MEIIPRVNGFTATQSGLIPNQSYRLLITREGGGKIAGLAAKVATDPALADASGEVEFSVTGIGLAAVPLSLELQAQVDGKWVLAGGGEVITIAIADAVPDAKLFIQAVNETGIVTPAQFFQVYARYLELKHAQSLADIEAAAVLQAARQIRAARKAAPVASTGTALTASE